MKLENMAAMKLTSSPSTTNTIHLSRFLVFILGFSFGMLAGFQCNLKNLSFESISSFSTPILVSTPESRPLLPISRPRILPQEHLSPPQNEGSLMHNMSDWELVSRALEVGENANSIYVPKVAFMFMVKGKIPLAPLWEMFFEGHEGFFSVYIHAHPSYNVPYPKESVFYGRNISSQEVRWGDITMMDAERRLLANALLDPSSERFVLLSESCIPLFNFTTVYNYLIGSNRSFLGCLDIIGFNGRKRYNRTMAPLITESQWRKGSEWFEVNRDLALKIIPDQKYYNAFKQHCHAPCYSDEHYWPTMVHILHPQMTHNRSLTRVNWASKWDPHPASYGRHNVTEELIHRMRFGSNCSYNGVVTNFCFLFARKILPSALDPLFRMAPSVLGFGH